MMACAAEFKLDASKCFGGICVPVPQVQQDLTYATLSKMLDHFSLNDLKTMLFLSMTDLHDKESMISYLKLAAKEEGYLKFQFSKKWFEEKYSHNDLIELFGTMKKFKLLKDLGVRKNVFKAQENKYKTIPQINKFLFSVCEELTDDEVKTLRCDLFPDISQDISAEELICLLLVHEKITCNDFNQLKQVVGILNDDDLISRIETYEIQCGLDVSSREFYPVRQPTFAEPSGLALIINQRKFFESEADVTKRLSLDERMGSDVDCMKLEDLWKNFGFEVEVYVDLTEEYITNLVQNLACRDVSCYDVFVMCIMSHGKKGCFYSKDSKAIDIDSFIYEIADNCMIGKPKLFFIQACQGDSHNEGVFVHQQPKIRRNLVTDSRREVEIVPKGSDFFKAVATIDNHVSYRDEQAGSLFISHLVKNVREYGDKEDIQAVLTRVKNDISEDNAVFNNQMYKQQPISTSTLRRKVVLKQVLTEMV